MLALLKVSEKRLRVSMISLSAAPLRTDRHPLERDAGGPSDCVWSSSDGMVTEGDGGRASGATHNVACGGGQGGGGDHKAREQEGVGIGAEGRAGGGG